MDDTRGRWSGRLGLTALTLGAALALALGGCASPVESPSTVAPTAESEGDVVPESVPGPAAARAAITVTEAPIAPEVEVAADEATVMVAAPAEPAESPEPKAPIVAERLARRGDEIMVAGQLFHIGTPVVLWTDPGGYDGYRVERRFAPWAEADWDTSRAASKGLSTPNRYGVRAAVLTPQEIEQVRGGGWPLELLQKVVDQFVLHYDAAGTSRRCFARLHDDRGLSIHFMLDVDGTIYQTLDLKERAWHATVANSRSIGIEIANVGAYADPQADALQGWYQTDAESGVVQMRIPGYAQPSGLRDEAADLAPARNEMVAGPIHGEVFHQYDLAEAQYAALAKLTAALSTVFPRIACDYPRDEYGRLITTTLSPDAWSEFSGVLGHYHIQRNKIDPGPALQWDRVIGPAREMLGLEPLPEPTQPVEAAPEVQSDGDEEASPEASTEVEKKIEQSS
ncbi:peptidoglycan recognition protein family protein [Actomonas aquatica]|uniref:N-acetylmuramoyl-L-alanine amidase n=1 Tax=Actomonas aquatica TaxID=2866162 RepID=A0ABZ1CCK8_9BACT|nr:peptidoglycan recognition family protein [Opitutus sp. WL0086]WRQ88035.1 N-acetylmuramoyl-L-alanine amidase [Opitutus sp. WL0086]